MRILYEYLVHAYFLTIIKLSELLKIFFVDDDFKY